MRVQRRILDEHRRLLARVEVIGDRTYLYDKLNRRVGWLAPNGTFNHLGRKISSERQIGFLIELLKSRGLK